MNVYAPFYFFFCGGIDNASDPESELSKLRKENTELQKKNSKQEYDLKLKDDRIAELEVRCWAHSNARF